MKEIKLTQGKLALVDDQDYERLSQWRWYAQNTRSGFYAVRKIGYPDGSAVCILMHRYVLGVADKTLKVDHRDKNTLNNQRENLRTATHSQNMANRKVVKNSSSKYLGVSWCGRINRWRAIIRKNNKGRIIESFRNEDDAALAYNREAVKEHGEFANLNQVPCGN